jgi:hypothetical protein
MDAGDHVHEAVVIAVREPLEHIHRALPRGRLIAGYDRVHLCLIARGYEPHFYFEHGGESFSSTLWLDYTRGMRWQAADGLRLRVERERRGLTRNQVATRSRQFGAGWIVDGKTVKAVEEGGPCAHQSRDSIARALGLRGEFVTYAAPELDFDELMAFGGDSDRA